MSDNMTIKVGANALPDSIEEQLADRLLKNSESLRNNMPKDAPPHCVQCMDLQVDTSEGVARLLMAQRLNSTRANRESSAVMAGVAALFRDPRKIHAMYLIGGAIVTVVATLIRVWTPSQNVTLSQQTTQPDARQAVLVQQLSESQAAITNFIAMMRSAANTNAPGGKP